MSQKRTDLLPGGFPRVVNENELLEACKQRRGQKLTPISLSTDESETESQTAQKELSLDSRNLQGDLQPQSSMANSNENEVGLLTEGHQDTFETLQESPLVPTSSNCPPSENHEASFIPEIFESDSISVLVVQPDQAPLPKTIHFVDNFHQVAVLDDQRYRVTCLTTEAAELELKKQAFAQSFFAQQQVPVVLVLPVLCRIENPAQSGHTHFLLEPEEKYSSNVDGNSEFHQWLWELNMAACLQTPYKVAIPKIVHKKGVYVLSDFLFCSNCQHFGKQDGGVQGIFQYIQKPVKSGQDLVKPTNSWVFICDAAKDIKVDMLSLLDPASVFPNKSLAVSTFDCSLFEKIASCAIEVKGLGEKVQASWTKRIGWQVLVKPFTVARIQQTDGDRAESILIALPKLTAVQKQNEYPFVPFLRLIGVKLSDLRFFSSVTDLENPNIENPLVHLKDMPTGHDTHVSEEEIPVSQPVASVPNQKQIEVIDLAADEETLVSPPVASRSAPQRKQEVIVIDE